MSSDDFNSGVVSQAHFAGREAGQFSPGVATADPRGQSRYRGPAFRGLLVGLAAGVLVGILFGEALWRAVGGPAERHAALEAELERVEKWLAQDPPAESSKIEAIRKHKEWLRAEIARLAALVAESPRPWDFLLRVAGQLIQLCGQLYLRLLTLIVLPLVFTSIMSGSAALGRTASLGRVAFGAFAYYLSTTAVAVLLGMVLVELIRPGSVGTELVPNASVGGQAVAVGRANVGETLAEVLRGRPDRPGSGLVPSNLFAAAAEMNVLGIIFFSLLAGLTLAAMGPSATPLLDLVERVNELMIRMVQVVMAFAPVGLFGLVAGHMISRGGAPAVASELVRLGSFAFTVVVGLSIHFVLLTILSWSLGRQAPGNFLRGVAPALATAFGTSSSSATLPVSLECGQRLGLSLPLARFVLPLGATVNMDGTALYEAVAAIFLAQLAGIHLGSAELVIVFIMATLAAIGAPGIPNAGLVTLLLVLAAVNVPAEGLGLILAIDWLLDRCRTLVNVFGDLVGLVVLDRFFRLTGEGR
ncbi:MAG: dicarboxylate/amino acid:cation symporter [Thermoguttaceae bacterium]|nr:dicarboxylate/amino acid:cation symporter [Thermoguttaceae bacterium]MDW8080063.1 dicarboxylate/amino acid:cation symporter [Thermoguttaceae bacterium]